MLCGFCLKGVLVQTKREVQRRETRGLIGRRPMGCPVMGNNMTSVRIITWNVRGLNNMRKRYGIQAYVKRRGAHVVMLQETHLLKEEGAALQKRWRAGCTTPLIQHSREES